MNYLNIPNYYIVGTASSSGAGGGGGHAWNAVSVDGGATYIYMDLTWDDLGEDTGFFYEYFGMPKTDFESTHFKYTSSGEKAKWLYDLNCILSDDFDNIYYNVSGLYYNGGDAGALAKAAKTRAHRLGNIVTFMANSLDKLRSVVSALGLSGYSYYNVSYKGTAYYIFSKRFTDKTDISGAEIILSQETYDYDGKPVEPIPSVICNGITLIRGLNYVVSYENNTSSDSIAKLKVSGCGNFYGEGTKNFTIGDAVIIPGPTDTPSPTPEPTDVPTPMPKKELTPNDFDGIDEWKAENITDENSFLYTGNPNPVSIWSTDLDCGEITIYYKAVGSDTWTSEAPVNAGKYLVAIDVEESEYCQAAEKLRADDWQMVIQPCLLKVKPDSLGKEVGDTDPELTFTYSLHYGNIVGVPGFKGSLVRETGEDTGAYKILQGTLELIDNGDFLASNYMIEFFPNVTFSIYTVPLDKTEVYVVSKTKHSVVLGWSKVDNAEGYTVRLNGESTPLVTTSELTCEITGLNTGGSYLFYVRPYRRSPEYYSANETSIEVTTEPRDVPTAADFDFLTEDANYDGMPHSAVIVPKDTEIQIGHIRYANVETPTYWSFDAPVEPGTYMVDIYVQQTENYEYVYDLTDSTWRFTIKSAGGKKGDVDGDDDITPKDVTMLRRHLAGGWNVTIIEANADVDGDGEITPKDVTILRRFLAGGWGVTLG